MAAEVSTARKVGRVVKTVLKTVLALVLAAVLVAINVILPGQGMIVRMANNMLGYSQSWTTPDGAKDVDANYYKSDFTADEIADAEKALDTQIASEGYVLLKNDDATMPFAEGTTFSFFSENVRNLTATQSLLTQFTGASGDEDKLTTSFEAKGLHVNGTLMEFYTKGAGSSYKMGPGSISFGAYEDFSVGECPLSELEAADGVLDSAKDTVSVFVWRRSCGGAWQARVATCRAPCTTMRATTRTR
ncbi:MAG: hypothetical protein J6D34_08620 [Atopobiaceae bacterium]|nr:hypothetical protein [Atopobiaceae bacterium]